MADPAFLRTQFEDLIERMRTNGDDPKERAEIMLYALEAFSHHVITELHMIHERVQWIEERGRPDA